MNTWAWRVVVAVVLAIVVILDVPGWARDWLATRHHQRMFQKMMQADARRAERRRKQRAGRAQ